MSKSTSPKTPRSTQPMNPVALGCWAVIVIAALFIGYEGYSASQTEPVVISTPTPVATVSIPTLALHQNYERQGPVITVNPSQIGKSDPFQ